MMDIQVEGFAPERGSCLVDSVSASLRVADFSNDKHICTLSQTFQPINLRREDAC